MSLRHRARTLFLAVILVFTAACVLATIGLISAHDGRNRLLDQLDPALQHTDDYLTSLVDQETGVRGYSLSHQSDFLQPYRSGVAAASSAVQKLRREISPIPSAQVQLDDIEHLVSSWEQQYVVPLLASPGARAPGDAVLARAKASFDEIRTAFVVLESNLAHHRADAVRGFDRAYWILVGVVGTVLALVALVVAGAGVTLRRSVIIPLLAVGTDSRRVAAGDLDHPVRRAGPTEIADLASDIEAMRDRIVRDLHAIDAARSGLEAQGTELARSNRDLEQFAYVASHDLQEPLRKVASFCQLLADRYRDELDERGVQYIDFAVDGAKRMQALVNDLLAFSRVGRSSESWTPVDLRVAADLALANLEHRLADSGGRVEFATALPTVRGDLSLLTALWQNLIGNSLKFRSDEPPVVTISSERSGADWIMTVADNGIGIEAQYVERVFVIFQRLHTRDRYEGTGIGLALCRKIVEFHGGAISVVTSPAGPDLRAAAGTTITFTLPEEAPVVPS